MRYSLENFLRAKAHYLARGPLFGRDAVIIWGAGMIGRRLSKHLLSEKLPLVAFIDIDPVKIGRTRRGRPIHSPDALPELWRQSTHPALLAAVGARGARHLIRQRLNEIGLREGVDWWGAA
jgi:FlaA1/EpsC-like NDP-sugar epimerase